MVKKMVNYVPMPGGDGGADFSLVIDGRDLKPKCKLHGAMNKVSPMFWRCVTNYLTNCRAGCMEEEMGTW